LQQKEKHDIAYGNLQKDHATANKLTRNEHDKAMNQLRNDYGQVVFKLEATLKQINENHAKEVQSMDIAHEAKIMKLSENFDLKSKLSQEHQDQLIKKLKIQHDDDKLKLRSDTDKELKILDDE